MQFGEQTEQPLVLEAERLAAVMNHVADGIITFDEDGRILSANPAAGIIFAYEPAQLVGMLVEQLMSEQRHTAPADFSQLHLQSHQTNIFFLRNEAVGRRQDGRSFFLDFTVSRMTLGAAPTFVGIVRDITRQKQTERALRQAKQAAESANRAKTEFLVNMSHEVRTPLNAVLGMAQLLQETPLTPEQAELTATIHQSGNRLLHLINDVLEFSKIEAGQLQLVQEPYDLRHCIVQALTPFAEAAATKEVELVSYVDEAAPVQVVGDALRLRQVLLNLVGNSVKFTETGQVVVRVKSEMAGNGRVQLQFIVKDSGSGIPPAKQERLFLPFSQIDASTTRRHGGVGLGLAISKYLVERMGGRISVQSQPGAGSTFYFTIRVGQSASPSRPDYLQPRPALLDGKVVLVVIENKVAATVLAQQLKFWGMQPIISRDPAQLENWLAQGRQFDVALLDAQLRSAPCQPLAKAIKSTIAGEDIPLILVAPISAAPSAPDPLFAATLYKPLSLSLLYQTLSDLWQPKTDTAVVAPKLDPETGRRHPLRILLVEDNQVNQMVARHMLQRLGYTVDIVGNGRLAVAAVAEKRYDVIFMDVQMPEMDGVEATRHIREQRPPHQQPRIVAMTAHALQGDKEHYLVEGMDDYISKPVRIEALTAALARCRPLAEIDDAAAAQTPPAKTATWPIDQAFTAKMLGDGAESLLADLLPLYFEDAPSLIAKLQQAMVAQDRTAVKEAAHTLKGSSATLGILTISDQCAALEAQSQEASFTMIRATVGQLAAELQRVQAALAD